MSYDKNMRLKFYKAPIGGDDLNIDDLELLDTFEIDDIKE
jgi:hypothetical protein